MCLRPKFIYVARDKTSSWKKQAYRHAINSCGDPALMSRIEPYFMNKVSVPCGKCSECLRQRQNDLAARVSMTAQDYKSMHFVTLTYNEESLPLSGRVCYVNKVTGEVILDSSPMPLIRLGRKETSPLDFCTTYRIHRLIESMPIRRNVPRVHLEELSWALDEDSSLEWNKCLFVTPSLHRRDVRLWFKGSRVAYERDFGEKLPDFKYVLAGEMGPKTQRPHYHLLLMGLSDKQVNYLVDRWKFGYKNVKKIPQLNADGTNGYCLAAKYVSKYITKGEHECETVLCGYAERPRLCLSRFVGTVLPDDWIPYLRCYDLFGEYDLDSLILKGTEHLDCPKRLSVEQLAHILSEYRKRAIRRYGERSWTTLPKCMFKRVFEKTFEYFDLYYEKTITKTRRSVVQMAFGTFVESDLLDNFVSELRQIEGISDQEMDSRISSFISSQKAVAEIADEAGQANLRSFYAKSIY